MAKRLKVGIFGATGEVGKAVTRMLSELDFIDMIYLEIREHNRHVLPGILYDYKGKETRKKEIDGRVYKSYVGDVICPIDVSQEGYSRFKDCDAILIAAAAPDLKEWRRSGDYSIVSLEKFIKERTEKKIERIKKEWDKFSSLSENPLNKEYTEYLSRNGFDSSQELDSRVFDCLMYESMSGVKDIHNAFNIINELDKSKKINVGYRSVEQLPPNIPLIKDYAKILKDLKIRSFNGLVMVLTNVPDYCCNILCAEAPELTEQTQGMTYLDMMRLNDLILPALNENLPGSIKIKFYSLGNHDVHMIPCYDQKKIEVNGRFKDGELNVALRIIDEFRKKIKEDNSLNDYEAYVSKLLKIFGPDTKKVASPLEHEVRAVKHLFKGMYYDESEIFTNSIFNMLNSEKKSGVFVTLPHVFDGTRIIAQPYEGMLDDATRARLEKCIKDHETMTRAFVDKGIIKGMPRLVPKEQKKETIVIYEKTPPIPSYFISAHKRNSKKLIIHDLFSIVEKKSEIDIKGLPSSLFMEGEDLYVISQLLPGGNRINTEWILERININSFKKTEYVPVYNGQRFGNLWQVFPLGNLLYSISQKTASSMSTLLKWNKNSELPTGIIELGPHIYCLEGRITTEGRELYAGSDNMFFKITDKDNSKEMINHIQFKFNNKSFVDLKSCGQVLFAAGDWNDNTFYSVETGKGELIDFESTRGIFDAVDADDYFRIATLASNPDRICISLYEKSSFPNIRASETVNVPYNGRPKKLKFIEDYLIVIGESIGFIDLRATDKKIEPLFESVPRMAEFFQK